MLLQRRHDGALAVHARVCTGAGLRGDACRWSDECQECLRAVLQLRVQRAPRPVRTSAAQHCAVCALQRAVASSALAVWSIPPRPGCNGRAPIGRRTGPPERERPQWAAVLLASPLEEPSLNKPARCVSSALIASIRSFALPAAKEIGGLVMSSVRAAYGPGWTWPGSTVPRWH